VLLLASLLIGYVPQAALYGAGALLLLGLVTGIGFRRGLLGSAWRMLLALAVARAGFWLPETWLIPMLTAAIGIMAVDVIWTIGGDVLREEADARDQEEFEERTAAPEAVYAMSAVPVGAGPASQRWKPPTPTLPRKAGGSEQVAPMPARSRAVAAAPPRRRPRVPGYTAPSRRTHLPMLLKLMAAAAMALAVVATAPPDLGTRTWQLVGLLVDYARALAGLISGSS
jgi:hypothetical protein